jgi:hypothetical protein
MHAPRLSSAARTLVLVLVTFAVPALASAANAKGDQATVDKVTALNKKALDAYGKQDYDTARGLLKEALEVCANAGLDQHPITARTHIHFGVVAIVGFKQREVGIKQFRKALEIQPDIKLTKMLVTPELQDAFEEAVLAGGGAAPGGGEGEGGAEGQGGQAQQSDDNGEGGQAPAPRRAKQPPRRKHGGDDDDKDDNEGGSGNQKGSFYLALAAGTGFGIASGHGALDARHKLSSPGFALAQLLQIAPEIGYFVTPQLLISVALRYQIVTGLNGEPVTTGCGSDMFCSPSTSAIAVFGKATYLMGTGTIHFALGGEIGGGSIRHAVSFSDIACKESASSTQLEGCVDTLDGGPFLIGPTFGLFIELGSALDLIVAVNTALGLPNFTFNFDLQGGLALRL